MSKTETDEPENKFLFIKDILIPVVGVLIAFVGLYATINADRRQELEAKSDREQKYLEFFLQNYADSAKQETAFLLLKYLNDSVRKDVIYSLSANTKLSDEAFKTLLGYNITLNFADANLYNVKVFYEEKFKNKANKVRLQLVSAGFTGKVWCIEKSPDFFYRYNGNGVGNNIKYNAEHDSPAMAYIYRFIADKNVDLHFRKIPVSGNDEPGIITVHLYN
jgi:hypothetical protein